ncbi:hypothetical protein [Comamonas sp. F1-6]|uniref:hypothetical protein n=1 Tax=Comamonas sp. F1-6 TaxID=673550 RepID=UPI0031CDD94B
MTGVWAKGYHFFVYDHHGPGRWNVIEWDGATHIVYALSTIINFPQKEINYFSYQIERYRKGQSTQFIDASLGVFFDLAEVAAGMANSMIGVLVGTVLNPLDTVRNLIPLLTMSIGSIVNSVTEFFKGVISLVTLGSYGACGTI